MSVVVRVKVVTDDKQFKDLVAKMKRSLNELGDAGQKAGRDIKDGTDDASDGLKNANKSAGDLVKQFKRMVGLGGASMALRRVARAAQDFAVTADRTRISLIALTQVGKSVGAGQADIRRALEATMDDGLLPINVALQNLQDLMRSGLGAEESIVLMTRLKDLAAINRSVHIDFQSAVLNLTQAFKTEQSRLGDLSGLTENFATNIIPTGIRAMNRMGFAVDKNSIALDDNMRALVKYHGIMELTEELSGGAKVMTEGSTGAIAEQEKAWVNLKVEMGRSLDPHIKTWAEFWARLAQDAADSMRETRERREELSDTLVGLGISDLETVAPEDLPGSVLDMLPEGFFEPLKVEPSLWGFLGLPHFGPSDQQEIAQQVAMIRAGIELEMASVLATIEPAADFLQRAEPGSYRERWIRNEMRLWDDRLKEAFAEKFPELAVRALGEGFRKIPSAASTALSQAQVGAGMFGLPQLTIPTTLGAPPDDASRRLAGRLVLDRQKLVDITIAGSDAWKVLNMDQEAFAEGLEMALKANTELFDLQDALGMWDEVLSRQDEFGSQLLTDIASRVKSNQAEKDALKAAKAAARARDKENREWVQGLRETDRQWVRVSSSMQKGESLYRRILEASRAEPQTLEEWEARLNEVNSSAKGLRDKFDEITSQMRAMARDGDPTKIKQLSDERNKLMREYLDMLGERKRIEGEIADRTLEALDLQVLKQQAVEDGIGRSTTAALEFAFQMREGQKIGDAIIDIWKRILVEMSAAIVKQAILNALQAMGFFSSFNLPFGGGGSGLPLDASAGVHAARGGVVPPRRPRYYAGGGFESRGTDTVPAMLTPGEGILTREATRNLGGAAAINALNRSQGAAMGGVNINIGGGTFVGPGGAREFAANLHAEMLDLIRTNDYEGLVA